MCPLTNFMPSLLLYWFFRSQCSLMKTRFNNLCMNKYLYFLLILFVFSSCATRNLIYFSDLPQNGVTAKPFGDMLEPLIQPTDYISIRVNTLNPETNILFNSGVISSI